MIPGMYLAKSARVPRGEEEKPYPRIVRQMLMSRSAPQPRSRNTPRGGRMMARMILQISLGHGQFDPGTRRESGETNLAVKGILSSQEAWN
jgi:hypothetical protein